MDTQKDEQTFEVYSNHVPTIVSNPPHMGLVGELFKYQLRVDDKMKMPPWNSHY